MNPPFGRRALVVALVAAIGGGGAACASERPGVSAPSAASAPATVPAGSLPSPLATANEIPVDAVAMVGDSITVGSLPALEVALASIGLEDVSIDAVSGRRMLLGTAIGSGLDAIEAIAEAETPDLWVIALGTNDVANYGPDEYAVAIAELLTAIPADAPLVWVDTYLESYPEESARFNAVLRRALASRGRATVVDWASIAGEDGVLTDGVHPSGFGIREFARRVVAAVDAWTA